MMARPLYGFRQSGGRILPEPAELAIVRRVLASRRGERIKAAAQPGESRKATLRRIERILRHASLYRSGRVLLGVPADRRLARLVSSR